jgi:hypothetical protein
MNIYLTFWVILAVSLLAMFGTWAITTRDRVTLTRLADPAPMPGERVWCQRCGQHHPWYPALGCLVESYGPFPVDTGPLLILSESAASADGIGREVDAMCARAEWLSRRRP